MNKTTFGEEKEIRMSLMESPFERVWINWREEPSLAHSKFMKSSGEISSCQFHCLYKGPDSSPRGTSCHLPLLWGYPDLSEHACRIPLAFAGPCLLLGGRPSLAQVENPDCILGWLTWILIMSVICPLANSFLLLYLWGFFFLLIYLILLMSISECVCQNRR